MKQVVNQAERNQQLLHSRGALMVRRKEKERNSTTSDDVHE